MADPGEHLRHGRFAMLRKAAPEGGGLVGRVASPRAQRWILWLGAVAFGVIWLVVLRALFATRGEDEGVGRPMMLLLALLPLFLAWVGVATLLLLRRIGNETEALRGELAALRLTWSEALARQAAGTGGRRGAGVGEHAGAGRGHEAADGAPPAPPASSPEAGPAASPHPAPVSDAPGPHHAPPADDRARQPMLALDGDGARAEAPLAVPEMIRALQFPDNADDAAGFRALRAALRDHETARLVRAAQDVLTLMSDGGIYTDDLVPEALAVPAWRRLARGERGAAGIAEAGAIRDPRVLDPILARMKEDTVFRDAAHHFLRAFDRVLQGIEPRATDEEMAALADTRTGRAFMLVGRAAGVFDQGSGPIG